MESANPFEKESIKGVRGLSVCSRSSCLTHTFLCFLMIFLHVGQSPSHGNQPLQSSHYFNNVGVESQKGGGNDVKGSTNMYKLKQE